MEGLDTAAPSLSSAVLPISLGILVALFAIQRFGTGAVGRLFGPVMAVWFVALALAGIRQIAKDPAVLKALSPSYGVAFFLDHPTVSFIALASIVLVVTGAEALYADLGHFGRTPIRLAWFAAVFPALTLNYLGQGSLILDSDKALDDPFYQLLPHALRTPMVFLATAATIIASQALISGAFSISRQAVGLSYLPRLTIRHTSKHEEGQIYSPAVNWTLAAGVVLVVLGFGSSAKLASAYGLAVTGTFVATTVLFLVIARVTWGTRGWKVAVGASVFLIVDTAFFAANLVKIPSGGWFPLIVGAIVFTLLLTWRAGSRIVTANRTEAEGPLRSFVEEIRTTEPPVTRVPGTAVFLNERPETTPLALRANLEHNHVLHQSIVILTLDIVKLANVPPQEQLTVDDLGYVDDGITHLTAHLGYSDRPDVPRILRMASERRIDPPVDAEDTTYFISHITLARSKGPGLAGWRKRVFTVMTRASADPAAYFGLPQERTIVMSREISV